MASGGEHAIKLHVYDLSNGMAMALSQSMLGKYIEGIWHTGIVVYGKEYYYGGGLQVARAGVTPYGRPVRVDDLGTTTKTEAEFQAFLATVGPEFTPESYHLLEHNCNHFTAAAVAFLNGGTIPDYVASLPAEFLATPLGAMLRPTIDSMMGGMGGALGESVSSTSSALHTAPPPPPSFRLATDTTLVAYTKFNAAALSTRLRTLLTPPAPTPPSAHVAATIGVDPLLALVAALADDRPAAAAADLPTTTAATSALFALGTDLLSGKDAFPALDVLRILLLEPHPAALLTTHADSLPDTIPRPPLATLASLAASSPVPHVRIMCYRALANIIHSPPAAAYIAADDALLDTLLDALFAGLAPDTPPNVVSPASGALHNVALVVDTADMSDAYLRLVAGLVDVLAHVDLATLTDFNPTYRLVKALAALVVHAPHGASLVVQLGLADAPWLASAASPPVAPVPNSPAAFLSEAAAELRTILSNAD